MHVGCPRIKSIIMEPVPRGYRTLRILKLQGSSYDVGVMHGRELRELVVAYYGLCRMILNGISEDKKEETLSNVESGLRERYAESLEEMRGIADGSGLSYEDILLTNFTSEVKSQASPMCTSFAASHKASKVNEPILGKTRDMNQTYYPFQIAMKIHVRGKAGVFLTEAFSGMVVTGCGINEYGLSLALNTIASINDADDTVGVQRAFFARLILEECKSLDEAIDLFSENDLAYQGANFLICDNKGECALIEKSHCHQAVIDARDDVIASTNHFTDPKMVNFGKAFSESSVIRLARISELLASNNGKIELPVVKSFLRDHACGFDTNSICRHTSSGANTIQAYILQPRSKRVFVSDGHPCLHRFQQYKPFN